MLIDLQLHSSYSDGYLSPAELVSFIARQGVKVASLTDHNTVGGLGQFRAACRKRGIKAINGLELYAKFRNHHFNVLWYNFDESATELHDLLRETQMRRRQLARKALRRMTAKGFLLDENAILDKFGHYIPMNRLIDEVLADRRNLNRIKKELNLKMIREEDVIRKYFWPSQGPKFKNSLVDISRIVKLKNKIGGQLILCHPAKTEHIKRDRIELMKAAGINGIEMLSPHHSYGAVMYIQHLAEEFDLIETGGSDFHRPEDKSRLAQNSWQYYKIESKLLRRVDEVIG